MTKKSWTRILIVIVAGLWGYNIYRTVENYQLKTESEEERLTTPMTFAPVMFNKDTFELFLPDVDPFLKDNSGWRSSATNSNNSGQNSTSGTQLPTIRPTPVSPLNQTWPEINYYGFLRNYEEENKLCMLRIDGRNYRLMTGEEKDDIKVLKAYPDSVVITFNNAVKTFLKI